MISYAALLLLAFACNQGDIKMLALSAVIGAGIFIPVPPQHFYLYCVFGEAAIGLSAYIIKAQASNVVLRMSLFLIIFHLLGLRLDGYPPESPYHVLVKVFEHAELLACILLSRPILKKMKNNGPFA